MALFGFVPWTSVPVMPVEIMLFPRWFPFHLDKVSYWSRTVIVPLLVLMNLKPLARNPENVRIDELFLEPPATLGPVPKAPQQNAALFWLFRVFDILLRMRRAGVLKVRRRRLRHRRGVGQRTAERRGRARRDLPGHGQRRDDVRGAGLSAEDHPQRAIARKSVEKLLVVHAEEAYCQPCVSPIWDTGLAGHALLEAGDSEAQARVAKSLRMARHEANSRRQGRLDRATAERAPRRLGVPVCQRALSRCRRHRSGGAGDGPHAERRSAGRSSRGDRPRTGMDHRAAKQKRRLGCVRRGQRATITSIIFRLPITALCSIRRPRMSPRAAFRCWRNSATCRKAPPWCARQWTT